LKARKREGQKREGARRAAGFNGAAPLKARKRQMLIDIDAVVEKLQWGRAVEGAETRTLPFRTPRDRCFNGAAPLKARKPHSRA